MIYIYRRKASASARELAEALEGRCWRRIRMPIQRKARRGDAVICWGEPLDAIPEVKILNGAPLRTKYADAVILRDKGVPTIEVTLRRPTTDPAGPIDDPAHTIWQEAIEEAQEFFEADFARSNVFRAGVQQLHEKLQRLITALGQPLPPPAPAIIWLPRTNNHVGGQDLLHPPRAVDYWVKRESIVREYRVHSFLNKSIRAGVKVLRAGVTQPHEWIRSLDGGWKVAYDGFSSKKRHRELAHQAVNALGLDFGAVDLGERADGSLFVLEVNRAPGLEGGTVTAYAAAITRWLEGGQ